jgi:hypothetical protein
MKRPKIKITVIDLSIENENVTKIFKYKHRYSVLL